MTAWPTLVFAVLLAQTASAQTAVPSADLVVVNARIYTADAARPLAQALAVRGDRLIFVGSTREADMLVGPQTRRLDLAGRTVIPGMVDAHAHLMGLGAALRTVDLVGTTSYDEIIARVVAQASKTSKGEWITGYGWDQNDWAETGFPTHERLSAAVPDHPVILSRVDGHASLVNARAMALAGLTAATPDPDGGRLLRGPNRVPTGVLIDRAQALVRRVVPPPSPVEQRARLDTALAEANRWGLTGIHDAGVDGATIDLYRATADAGRFTLRDYVMISGDDATLNRFLPAGPQLALDGGRLWIRAIKLYADGALGSRGAAMLEPYSDEPGNRGLVVTSQQRIEAVAARALAEGFQLNTHAIGDRANRMVLDAIAAALAKHPVPDHRFRIEHAQLLAPEDIPRFAELGMIPSMQGSHQTSDMYWAVNRIGPTRALGAYAWRSLLNSGVIIPNGSDFPVESPNPLLSFTAFVSRMDQAGWPAGGWYPAQRTTREEALLSMTLWPAMAAFMEHDSGSLTPGKYADFVVLDQDIMTVPVLQIRRTQVLRTVLGGQTVYRAEGAP